MKKLSTLKLSVGIVILLLGALILSACTAATEEPAATEETSAETPEEVQGPPQTITFMITGTPEEQAAYETLIAGFKSTISNVDVVLNNVPDDEFERKLATMFSASAPPDIFLMNFRNIGVYASEGALYPLDSLIASSQQMKTEDFYPAALKAFTYNGGLQCLPQNLSSPVIYYNKALFDAAGVAYPQAGWTWDDFVTTARALTKDTDGDGTTDQFGFGTSVQAMRLAPFVWQNGGDFLDDYANPSKLTLDTPEAREAITWFANLQLVEHVMPDAVAEEATSSSNRFVAGTLGMFMNSRVSVPTLRSIEGFEWDAAPLPTGKQQASVLHSDGFCVPTESAKDPNHLKAIWSFIEYAFSATGQSVLAETGRTVPSRTAVAESDAFMGSVPPANNQAWLDAADYMRAFPVLPQWTAIEGVITNELKRAVYGNATIDEAIQAMEDGVAEILNQ